MESGPIVPVPSDAPDQKLCVQEHKLKNILRNKLRASVYQARPLLLIFKTSHYCLILKHVYFS